MSHASNAYVVILAGGVGKRFQPYSTPEKPKQFLPITHDHATMIQQTYERVMRFVPPSHVFVSTNDRYTDLVAEQLPDVPRANVIGEPRKKNTAPAIALITHLIERRDPKAVTMFLPSDHYIAEPAKAVEVFKQGISHAAAHDVLVTFGILPTFASPEFGYIHRGAQVEGAAAYRVAQFVEKPDVPTAERYLATKAYYWNGGMFVWKPATLMAALAQHKPEMARQVRSLELARDGAVDRAWLDRFFDEVEEISIDYAVMEKATNVEVLPFDCGWSDVGTWDGLADLAKRFKLDLPLTVREYLSKAV